MKKWTMIIDVAECTNCQNCTLAIMDEYVGNDFPGYAAPCRSMAITGSISCRRSGARRR